MEPKHMIKLIIRYVLSPGFLCLIASAAYAAAAGGGGYPWDVPIVGISQDLSGPMAAAISLLGLAAIFMTLIFGGELNHWARTLVFGVAAASTLAGVAILYTKLGIAGAVIT